LPTGEKLILSINGLSQTSKITQIIAVNALLRDCKEVISERNKGNDQKVAMATLPPQPGFFFGSTDIDEDYYEDIENTINQLESILNNPKLKDFDFYYQASW
jgi:hypothetical protein